MNYKASCPLTTKQIIDEYFLENRTRVLELAAFLDRLERSSDQASDAADFRIQAFRRALVELTRDESGKIDRVQLVFSDPTTEPRPKLDEKSASGAWNPVHRAGKVS
jgi:hypothetical protein